MRLISVPANPVPDDVITGTLKTPDGVALRFARWPAPRGGKGTVCILHGRTEFIEKYFEMVRDLRARGFAVVTLDFRGQGLSQRLLDDPRKGYVADFADYETDLVTLMKDVVLPDCPPPYYGLGHSTGATVLLRAAASGYHWFERMVLCAPLLGLSPRGFPRYAEKVVRFLKRVGMSQRYIPGGTGSIVALKPFAGNIVTSDPVRYARSVATLETEPALGIGSPTIGWTAAAFEAMHKFEDPLYLARITQPTLMLSAGRDVVVSMAHIEAIARKLRTGAHLVINGSKHEIMMEQDQYREQFWAAFDAFIPGTPY